MTAAGSGGHKASTGRSSSASPEHPGRGPCPTLLGCCQGAGLCLSRVPGARTDGEQGWGAGSCAVPLQGARKVWRGRERGRASCPSELWCQGARTERGCGRQGTAWAQAESLPPLGGGWVAGTLGKGKGRGGWVQEQGTPRVREGRKLGALLLAARGRKQSRGQAGQEAGYGGQGKAGREVGCGGSLWQQSHR